MPTNEKAQKTFRQAQELERKHDIVWALDAFKKADKQDDGHCMACQMKMVLYGIQTRDWKTAEVGGSELVAGAQGDRNAAKAHFMLGLVYLNKGFDKEKDEIFARAHDEFSKALALAANFPDAVLSDGRALAYLKQDDAAKARFEQFVKLRSENTPERQRALRYIAQPELARARMAPAFAVTTLEGKRVALDDFQGRVVLLDFWATWCAPCREALPHIKDLAKKFQGQPLVILSVSLDSDEQKWKDFVVKNEMTWPQYYDGGFTGSISKLFRVEAIPHTFIIDSDGILQDERIGDASIEGKIKKLLARAQEGQLSSKQAQ